MSFFVPPQKAVVFPESMTQFFEQRQSATGKSVTEETALRVATVFACMRVIGEGIAQVPLKLIKEGADGRSRLPARDHSLYDLLAYRANPWQTSFEFRETLAWHVGLTGNFIAFKNVVGGKIIELIPFEPGCVVANRDDFTGVMTYDVVLPSGVSKTFPAEAIWHVRGPSWNSWMGLDAVVMAREAIGLAMATEEQHARMHKNGVRHSGVYSVDAVLDQKQFTDLRNWIEREMGGPANVGRPMVLDRAAKWLNTSYSGVDSQHLETRRYQVEEVCRFFRVMPIMVGYSDKAATYASAEQMFLAHVVHTLSPWYQRLEQSIDANLLTKQDRAEGYYSQFVEEGLLRGDSKATAEYLTKLSTNGIMTRNEARAKLDLNPLDGLDEPLTPANMNIGTDGTPAASQGLEDEPA
jgi:HK97 family phage portal protein